MSASIIPEIAVTSVGAGQNSLNFTTLSMGGLSLIDPPTTLLQIDVNGTSWQYDLIGFTATTSNSESKSLTYTPNPNSLGVIVFVNQASNQEIGVSYYQTNNSIPNLYNILIGGDFTDSITLASNQDGTSMVSIAPQGETPVVDIGGFQYDLQPCLLNSQPPPTGTSNSKTGAFPITFSHRNSASVGFIFLLNIPIDGSHSHTVKGPIAVKGYGNGVWG